jgi:hypothetical protein
MSGYDCLDIIAHIPMLRINKTEAVVIFVRDGRLLLLLLLLLCQYRNAGGTLSCVDNPLLCVNTGIGWKALQT